MKTELVPHIGIDVAGNEVYWQQWWVTVDGMKAGILLFKPGSPIAPLIPMMNMSEQDRKEVEKQTSALAGWDVGDTIPFYIPPIGDLSGVIGFDGEEQEDEEDDD